jgi:hypothetical protein
MNLRVKKRWAPVLGLTLALSVAGTVGGVALADGEEGWYDGGNATVPDPDQTDVALTLYGAGGTPVTSGSITAPIASYAQAADDLRAGDEFATLFVHLPQSSTAPGAWPGLQVTGTDAYDGDPRVATTADGYTLADVIAALPNEEAGASFAGVYELRLRTSSETAGVGTAYAATWVKVTGSTWELTTAPILGDEEPVDEPVATSVAATWPAALRYGTAASVGVTVTPESGEAKPTGSVRLVLAGKTIATAPLSAAGTASLAVPRTLAPGARSLQVAYDGAAEAFDPSVSAAKAFTVAKATPSKPVLKVSKKPTAKKAGAAAVTVGTPAGLAKASGKGSLSLVKGKTVKKVAVTVTNGVASVKLPKLPKGTWTATFVYAGDTFYVSATSAAVKIASKAK